MLRSEIHKWNGLKNFRKFHGDRYSQKEAGSSSKHHFFRGDVKLWGSIPIHPAPFQGFLFVNNQYFFRGSFFFGEEGCLLEGDIVKHHKCLVWARLKKGKPGESLKDIWKPPIFKLSSYSSLKGNSGGCGPPNLTRKYCNSHKQCICIARYPKPIFGTAIYFDILYQFDSVNDLFEATVQYR